MLLIMVAENKNASGIGVLSVGSGNRRGKKMPCSSFLHNWYTMPATSIFFFFYKILLKLTNHKIKMYDMTLLQCTYEDKNIESCDIKTHDSALA